MASTSTTGRQSEIETTYAFDEIAPQSISVSATSSSTLRKLPCRVFINHRGPDVKDTLARAIYQALYVTGLGVFLDFKELELGDFLPETLEEAMSSASLHVAIFSPTYARSPWCLAELSFMLKTGAPIIPVFYHVQPTDLRWVEKGMYASAFSEHQEKGRYSLEKLQDWKRALHIVSFYMGEIINNEDEEREKLKNIVNHVLKQMKVVPLRVAKYPVGLEEAVANFEKTVCESASSHPNVQIVGIWGMGGSGKTTLAKELYNKKYSSIQSCSFVFDIRNAASKNELHKKQEILLKDLGVTNIPDFDNTEKGQEIISNRLRSICVLIILDDVDHTSQLDALLPSMDSLAQGSLVIITTREREVLTCWGISSIHEIRTLNPFHAKELFCWHAFLQPNPQFGFEELVEKFLKACNGLPLSLKVLGAQLYCCSNKDLWEGLLDKISKILPKDIKNRLRVSYDTLDEEEKQIFLDVACFLIGEEKIKAFAVWEESGCSGLYSWNRLVNKCLVDLDDNNCIRMHDHLRDLGREIANNQSPYRLWSPKQITGILKQDQERIQIRGMILNASKIGVLEFPRFLLNAKRLFPLGLKIFVLKGNFWDNLHMAEVSRELVWFNCTRLPHTNLPTLWPMLKNLRVLELYESWELVGLWKDGLEAPMQLRVLIISDCLRLRRVPESIGHLMYLKQMSLTNCNLESLPEEFCRLQSLEHLQLKRCNKLSSLPSCFGNLRSLRHLDLSGSSKLMVLPDSFKQVTMLQHLNLENCWNLALGLDIMENMTQLKYFNFSTSHTWCNRLEELPRHITNQASLMELYLMKTKLKELPIDIGQLNKLRVMKIGSLPRYSTMQSLPESMGCLNLLEDLVLECLRVETLPKSFNQLVNLETLKISSCPISELDFGRGPFTSSLCNLEKIDLYNTEVSKISISEECCPRLVTLRLRDSNHLREVDTLPTTVKVIEVIHCKLLRNISCVNGLVNLDTLMISGCPELDALPSFAKLGSLKVFELRKGNKVKKLEGLQHCSALKQLVVECTCWEVPGIESLEQMQGLRTLQLVAKKRAAVETCIQTIQPQKWPAEIIICTKAVPGAESLLEPSAFPNLSVLNSFANKKIRRSESLRIKFFPFLKIKMQGKCSSNANAMMLCLIINCLSPRMELVIKEDDQMHKREDDTIYRSVDDPMHKREDDPMDKREDDPIYGGVDDPIYISSSTEMEEGKWIWIGVFTQYSRFLTVPKHYIVEGPNESNLKRSKVEKGFLVTGDENSIVKHFHSLLELAEK